MVNPVTWALGLIAADVLGKGGNSLGIDLLLGWKEGGRVFERGVENPLREVQHGRGNRSSSVYSLHQFGCLGLSWCGTSLAPFQTCTALYAAAADFPPCPSLPCSALVPDSVLPCPTVARLCLTVRLHCHTLPCPVLPCPARLCRLSCPTLYCLARLCPALPDPALPPT